MKGYNSQWTAWLLACSMSVYSSATAGRGKPGRLPGSLRRAPISDESPCGAAGSVLDAVVGAVSEASGSSSTLISSTAVASVDGSVTPPGRRPPGLRGRKSLRLFWGPWPWVGDGFALAPTCKRGRVRSLVKASGWAVVVSCTSYK